MPLDITVMNAPAGVMVDHIDGNTLNNQRENLQLITNSRNLMKSKRALGGGIFHRLRPNEYWEPRMRVDGRIVRLGIYKSKEEAEAVLAAAREHVWNLPEFNPDGVRLQ